MPSLKVLITGPFNAGKTRFIRSASDVPPVLTEEATFGAEGAVKSATTVALDYGKVVLRDVHIYLFGTPGQERFFFMRELLAQGMDAYVALVDSTDPDVLERARGVLTAFAALGGMPYVIAATKADRPGALSPDELRDRLGLGAGVEILPCNARKRSSVHHVLTALLDLPDLKLRP